MGVTALLALVGIVTFSVIRGGLVAFGDNPVHLAEIRDLAGAGSRGWSDLAYCGFPLELLQPPLTFRAFALIAHEGGPLEAVYNLVLAGSLAAPAIAFFLVARRRLGAFWACALAATLVVYRGSLIGEAAAIAGMFGFHYATAALLLVLDRLVRPTRTLLDVAVLAALAAFIGLSHMYITIALVYLALVHTGWTLYRGRDRVRVLWYDLPALALGAAAAAAYWMPNVLAHTPASGSPEPPLRVLVRLVTTGYPLPPRELNGHLARILFDPIWHLDAPLQLAVCLLALLGIRAALKDADDAPRYGLTLGALFLFLLFIQPLTRIALLGPQGMRLVYVAKIGFLVATIPYVRQLSSKIRLTQAGMAAVGASALGLAALSGHLVSHQAVDDDNSEVTDLARVWSWMANHKTQGWGRVYVQDAIWVKSGYYLADSHLLAQTAERAHVEQLGSYYGSNPYVKSWLGDGGSLFGMSSSTPDFIDEVVDRMARGNATHLLLVDPKVSPRFASDPRFAVDMSVGRYTLLERRGAIAQWGRVLEGTGDLSVARVAPGHIQVAIGGNPERIEVNESYHPFWRLEPADAGRIGKDGDGLIVVDRLAKGRSGFDLIYRPPSLPMRLTLLGCLGIAALFAAGVVAKRGRALLTD